MIYLVVQKIERIGKILINRILLYEIKYIELKI